MNNNELAKALIEGLNELKDEGKTFRVIPSSDMRIVSNLINKIINDKYNYDIGILEAKVYAYEQIIANSNFKAILVKEKDRKETTE